MSVYKKKAKFSARKSGLEKGRKKIKLPLFNPFGGLRASVGNFFARKGLANPSTSLRTGFSSRLASRAFGVIPNLIVILALFALFVSMVGLSTILLSLKFFPAQAAPYIYTENFTTTTYKDAANTTGEWDTTLEQAKLSSFSSILATAGADWSARLYHKSVVYDNKMWVIGGGTSGGYGNDVWYSTNGVNWTQATASAGWS